MSDQVEMAHAEAEPKAAEDLSGPQVLIEHNGAVAVLRLSDRPGNRLGLEMRRALLDAVEHLDQDASVRAIVLLGHGASFCTGFPPEGLDRIEAVPTLTSICDRIERCAKPVVASMHGMTREAGVALALAAHYRVMGRSAHLATPDVTFGLVPTGGVTQRLPRLVGARAALEILLTGRPLPGEQAHSIGMIDELAKGRVGEAAIAFAQGCIDQGKGPRQTRDAVAGLADGPQFFEEIRSRREAIRDVRIKAPGRIIDCVEAALMLPFDAGVEREGIVRADCFASDETRALRHSFLCEERVARLRGVEGVEPREVETLGLVGTGGLSLGLVLAALDHGMEVRLVGPSPDQLVLAEQKLDQTYQRAVRRGLMNDEIRQARLAAFSASPKLGTLTDAELVLEMSGTTVEARPKLLARVEEFMAEDAVLATISDRGFPQLAQDLAHPERFLGLHVFMPSLAIRVIELARPSGTSDQAVATAHGFVRDIGKIPVITRARDGLVANTLQEAAWAAVDVLLLMGARPSRIDRVMRDYGFPVGPCEIMDALGLQHMTGDVAQYLAAQGRGGKVTGTGFYYYVDGKRGDDDAAEALLSELRAQGGVPHLQLSDQDIRDRIVLAQANAGARLLQAGVVERPEEIDVIMMLAKGYPRFHGGPMLAADMMGVLNAENRLKSYAPAAPEIWQPATIWRELSKNGDNFEKINFI